MNNDYYITTEKSRMDVDLIHKYLTKSYWAKGRSKSLVLKSMENSICFGIFDKSNNQIGFARVVSDLVVFAWLMDVFILDSYQGKGIGKILLKFIFEYPEFKNVNGIGLRTNDAHALYAQFGFERIPNPETWMLKKNT